MKRVLREKLAAERRAAARARPDAARHAAANFIRAIPVAGGQFVSLYHPLKDEMDTLPLAEALVGAGAILALPVVERKNAPLAFRRFAPGETLIKGLHGPMAPAPEAEEVTPDIVVAPLLGFTRAGGRIGYGGGYYDRTLAALREKREILAVGLGFGAQEVDRLPLEPLDQPLDWIVTEREAIRAGAREKE